MWRKIFSLFLVFVNVREGISICKWPCAWQGKIFLDTWVTLDNHEMNQIWRFKGSKATIDGSTRVCLEINGPFITLLDEDNRRHCWRVDVISANAFISIGNLGAVNDTNFCANCDIPPDNPIHKFTAFGVSTPVNADIGCFIPEQCYSTDPDDVKCTWKEKPLKECKKC